MSLARNSLRNFLIHTKNNLSSAISKGQRLTFVIGNESADLDSLTSSLLFAYIRSSEPPPKAFSRFYVPILNIPASDIGLRPEFLALLPHANVEPDLLITLDDLPSGTTLKSRLPPEMTQWILVDHNALQGVLGSVYSARLGGVIDHHEDEHKVPEDVGSEPRVIQQSGSCSSLVTMYCRDTWDSLSSQDSSLKAAQTQETGDLGNSNGTYSYLWDAQIAKLTIASILIDTANLNNEDRVTKHDVEAVAYLEAKIKASIQGSKDYDRDRLYGEITEAKLDIGKLKLRDILRKDFKQWTEGKQTLGIASVVKDFDFIIDKAVEEQPGEGRTDAFLHAVDEFTKEKNLDLFAIMTTSTSASGEFQRELFLSAVNAPSVQIAANFEESASAECGLSPWNGTMNDIDHTGKKRWRRIWQQHSLEYSRKQVAPLLREAMKA